jgi:TrmH family RNA methyltransferase|tara:strand:- start:679 stop:1383 length:705 start_codon:yes stop_codon:yes gene_type:complete
MSDSPLEEIAICLIEPKYSINVGYVARIMKNFGFGKLLLIDSEADLIKARPFASHAVEILENVEHIKFEDLYQYDTLIATTAITSQRGLSPRQSISISKLQSSIQKMGNKICIIFGRDTTGLTNEELQNIDVVVHIPTNSEYPTLNISHALSIILYELTNYELVDKIIADHSEINRTIDAYVDVVELIGLPSHKLTLIRTSMQNILKRSRPSPRENSVLLGFAHKIKLHLRKKF